MATPTEDQETEEDRIERLDDAAYFVLATLDDLLFGNNLARCREILMQANAEQLPVEILLTLLAGTFRVREEMGEAREGLCRRVEEKLRRDAPDRVELLLGGLR